MDYKDTVMHLDDIENGRMPDTYASLHKALEKQAEISFKAGRKEEYTKWIQAGLKAGVIISKPEDIGGLIKEGRKEVVDWVGRPEPYGDYSIVVFTCTEWHNQLKIWFKDSPELLKELEL